MDRPTLRFEHGNPTDDEVAAVVVALRTLTAHPRATTRARPRSRWARKDDLLRQPLGREWVHPLRG